MINFVPLAQLGGPSTHIPSAGLPATKHVCMFCQTEFRTETEYARHLDTLHPGWAMLLLQKMGMNIARENG